MNNSIIKLIITLVTFSSVSFIDSHSIDKRSPPTEGVIIGPETPVYYVECPLNDCLVLNKSVNKFEASPSYYYYRNPENQLNGTFFLKVLVILDWDSKIKNGEQEILNKVLTKWNAADKYFEQLDDPKIKLAIAGVIIPTQSDIWRTTYPKKNSTELSNSYTATSTLNNMTKWLIDNPDHFGSLNYDVFIFLSRRELAHSEGHESTYVNYREMPFNCNTKTGPYYHPVGAIVNKDYFANQYAYSVALMLNIEADQNLGCETGYLMSINMNNIKETWSEYSKREFKSKVNNSTCGCLHQIPYGQYENDFTFFRKND